MSETTQFDRLCELRSWLIDNHPSMSGAAIERKLGVKAGYFQVRFNSHPRKSSKHLRQATLRNLAESWKKEKPATPPLSLKWMLSGEGDMFLEERVVRIADERGTPYYNTDLLNCLDEIFMDEKGMPDYFISYAPFERDANIWCNYTGDSMSPKLVSGDKICVGRLITVDEIIYGEMYALQTRSGLRVVRWVTRGESDEYVRLIPENKDSRYGDYQDIRKNDILYIYKVMGTLRTF